MPTRNDIVYVDKNDKAIGSSKTLEAYRNGHITRLCRMFIINKDGFLLIQQRAKNLTLPNKWCESASGLVLGQRPICCHLFDHIFYLGVLEIHFQLF